MFHQYGVIRSRLYLKTVSDYIDFLGHLRFLAYDVNDQETVFANQLIREVAAININAEAIAWKMISKHHESQAALAQGKPKRGSSITTKKGATLSGVKDATT